MRGPEEPTKSSLENGTTLEGETCSEKTAERDPCSSPPCKRLKQAVLNFQSAPSPSSSAAKENLCNGGSTEDAMVIAIDADKQNSCGGLVTASPPNKEISKAKPPDLEINDINHDEEKEVIALPTTPTSDHNGTATSPSSSSRNNSTQSSTTKTPVRLLSSAEKKKEQQEKLKRKEKVKQKEEAKAAKEKERLETKQKKEQEKLEKQAEKEKREKEKMEKKQKEDKERQEKKEKREEGRKKKEEEQNVKRKKEEEKRKKEEGKKMQEEELEKKKLKARNSFKSFFTVTPSAAPKTSPKTVLKFAPFEIKPDMNLAPLCRVQFSKESLQELDTNMNSQSETALYFEELQKRKPVSPYKRERRRKTFAKPQHDNPTETSNKTAIPTIELIDDDDDANSDTSSIVEIQEDQKKAEYMKVIFLKFHENNRPPYYGTHRKSSKKISPRDPLKKDEAMLNYEVDSDDEWEEEEPGESLLDSETEGDNEEDTNEEGDEEDDGWMVPHGYLSDDEGVEEGNEEEGNIDAKKEQQLAKVQAWEAQLKKKCKAMRPVCLGCLWPDGDSINEVLQRFEACLLVDGPSIPINAPCTVSADTADMSTVDTASDSTCNTYNTMYVPEEAMPDLIKVLHGSTGMDKLVNYFKLYWLDKCNNTEANPTLAGKGHISKRQLNRKIRAIAKKESRPIDYRPRWYVLPSVLASYGLDDLRPEVEMQEPNVRLPVVSPPMIKPGTQQVAKPVTQNVAGMPRPNTIVVAQQVVNKPIISTMLSSDQVQIVKVHCTKPSPTTVPVAHRRVAFQTLSATTTQTAASTCAPGVGSMASGSQIYMLATNQVRNSSAKSSSIPTEKRRVVLQTVPPHKPHVTSAPASVIAASGNQVTLPAGNVHTLPLSNSTEKRRVVLQTVPPHKPHVTSALASVTAASGNQATLPAGNVHALPLSNSTEKRRVVLQTVPPHKPHVTSALASVTAASGNQVTLPSGNVFALPLSNSTEKRRVVLQTVPPHKPHVTSAPASVIAASGNQVTLPAGNVHTLPLSNPTEKRRVVLQTVPPHKPHVTSALASVTAASGNQVTLPSGNVFALPLSNSTEKRRVVLQTVPPHKPHVTSAPASVIAASGNQVTLPAGNVHTLPLSNPTEKRRVVLQTVPPHKPHVTSAPASVIAASGNQATLPAGNVHTLPLSNPTEKRRVVLQTVPPHKPHVTSALASVTAASGNQATLPAGNVHTLPLSNPTEKRRVVLQTVPPHKPHVTSAPASVIAASGNQVTLPAGNVHTLPLSNPTEKRRVVLQTVPPHKPHVTSAPASVIAASGNQATLPAGNVHTLPLSNPTEKRRVVLQTVPPHKPHVTSALASVTAASGNQATLPAGNVHTLPLSNPTEKRRVVLQTVPPHKPHVTSAPASVIAASGNQVTLPAGNVHTLPLSNPTEKRRVVLQTVPLHKPHVTSAPASVFAASGNQVTLPSGNVYALPLSNSTEKRRVVLQTVPPHKPHVTSAPASVIAASGNQVTLPAGNLQALPLSNSSEKRSVVLQTLPATKIQTAGITMSSNTASGNASAFRRVTPQPRANSTGQTKLVLPGNVITSPVNAVASVCPTGPRRVQLQIVGSTKMTRPAPTTLGDQSAQALMPINTKTNQATLEQGSTSRQSSRSAKRRVVFQTLTPANAGAKDGQHKTQDSKSEIATTKNLASFTQFLTQAEPTTKNVSLEASSATPAQKYTAPSTAIKRQAPSPDSSGRAAKVLKSEETIPVPHNEKKDNLNKSAIENAKNPAKENLSQSAASHSSSENSPALPVPIATVPQSGSQCNQCSDATERACSQPKNNLNEGIQPMDIETISS